MGEECGGENGPSAAVIGHCFVKQYYNYLRNAPGSLHKLYKAGSILSRSVEGESVENTTQAFGPDEIHGEIMSSVGPYEQEACSAKITGIDSQELQAGGVLVLVSGQLTFSQTQETRSFSQAFVLDRQLDPYPTYFVLNDILRYAAPPPADAGVPRASQEPWQADPPPAEPPVQPPQPPQELAAEEQDFEEEEEEEAEEQQPPEAEEPLADEGGEQACGEDEEEAEEELEEENLDGAAEEGEDEEALEEHHGVLPKEPLSWASMATRLKQGPGQLAPSKRSGFGMSGAANPKMPVLPSPGTSTKTEAAKAAVGASPVAASPPAKAPALDDGKIRVWLSRLPADREAEGKEVVECINGLIEEAGASGKAVEVQRKDPAKDWGYLVVSSQEAADMVVQLCKDRKLQFRGKPLKAQPLQTGTPKTAADGEGHAEDKGGSLGSSAAHSGGRPKGGGRGQRPSGGSPSTGLPPPGSTGAGSSGTAGGAKAGGKRGSKGGRGDGGGSNAASSVAATEGGGGADGGGGGGKGGRRGGKGGSWRSRG